MRWLQLIAWPFVTLRENWANNPHLAFVWMRSEPHYHLLGYTLKPRQDGRHFSDDIVKSIFLYGNYCILIPFPKWCIPKGPIEYKLTFVELMAWRRTCDKLLSEKWWHSFLTHIRVTWPQWVNTLHADLFWGHIQLLLYFPTKKCPMSLMSFVMDDKGMFILESIPWLVMTWRSEEPGHLQPLFELVVSAYILNRDVLDHLTKCCRYLVTFGYQMASSELCVFWLQQTDTKSVPSVQKDFVMKTDAHYENCNIYIYKFYEKDANWL